MSTKIDLEELERDCSNHIPVRSWEGKALIARIRELEGFARTLIDDHVRDVSSERASWMNAILERGAVLP